MEVRVAALRQVYAAASQSHVFKFFDTLSEVATDHPCPEIPARILAQRFDVERRNSLTWTARQRGMCAVLATV